MVLHCELPNLLLPASSSVLEVTLTPSIANRSLANPSVHSSIYPYMIPSVLRMDPESSNDSDSLSETPMFNHFTSLEDNWVPDIVVLRYGSTSGMGGTGPSSRRDVETIDPRLLVGNPDLHAFLSNSGKSKYFPGKIVVDWTAVGLERIMCGMEFVENEHRNMVRGATQMVMNLNRRSRRKCGLICRVGLRSSSFQQLVSRSLGRNVFPTLSSAVSGGLSDDVHEVV
jgi:hypothetical protein